MGQPAARPIASEPGIVVFLASNVSLTKPTMIKSAVAVLVAKSTSRTSPILRGIASIPHAPTSNKTHSLRNATMKQYDTEWVLNAVQQLKADLASPPSASFEMIEDAAEEQENVALANAPRRVQEAAKAVAGKKTAGTPLKMRISIEGNIGAGKSTLLRVMDKWFGEDMIETLPEPVESWKNCNGQNLLESFYQEPARYAYTFQSYAFISRMAQIQQTQQIKSVRILERSPLSDYCFAKNAHMNGIMNDVEWAAYQAWWSFFMHNNSPLSLLDVSNPLSDPQQNQERVRSFRSLKPDAIIYLRTNPEICFKRMQIRNRSEEAGVPLSYLQQLHEHHDQWFPENATVDAHHQIPFVMLDANGEFETDRQLQMNFVIGFVEMIRSSLSLPPLSSPF